MAGDGVALRLAKHPYLITEEMRAAGAVAMRSFGIDSSHDHGEIVAAIYESMLDAAPHVPDDISEDALETAEIEIKKSALTVYGNHPERAGVFWRFWWDGKTMTPWTDEEMAEVDNENQGS